MAVDTTTRKVSFTMSAVATYDFTFRALTSAPTDIKVKRTVIATSVETNLVYTTDYTVAVNSNGIGGTVTIVTTYGSTHMLTIYRETTDLQESDYADFNQFPADTLEEDLDKRVCKSQEAMEDIARALKVSVVSTLSNITIPNPNVGKALIWSTGGVIINSILDVDTNAVAAATSAATALAAQVAASASAVDAAASAAAALLSQYGAATSATTSVAAATSATTSQVAAATSATTATSHATTAITHSTLAGNYASTASTQATAAATSATAALASQVAAATSATAALASQVAAATSATAALSSQVSAATSATTAIAAATAATLAAATSANTALSNLASVAVLADISPATTGTIGLGTALLKWLGAFARTVSTETLIVSNSTVAAGRVLTCSATGLTAWAALAASGDMLYADARIKVNDFVYDLATASGTMSTTGIGFQPKHVIFFANLDTTKEISWGIDDGTYFFNLYQTDTAGVFSRDISAGSINMYLSTGNTHTGRITAFGADGFTITWTKTGTITGTARIGFMAFR